MSKIAMGLGVAALVAVAAPFNAGTRRCEPIHLCSQFGNTGVASWYGEQFQGEPTASGKAFDMNALTAAYRNLPLGARIRVTNLRNNRSVMLLVNDRGPFTPGRMLDVSRAAAQRLGFFTGGLALVRVDVISAPPRRDSDALCLSTLAGVN